MSIKKVKYSKLILEKISEKRRIREQWQLSRCSLTKTHLNRITKNLKQLLDAERKQSVQAYLQQLGS